MANHIRALLDILEHGNFTLAQGMNKDYICNPDYDTEIFAQVSRLKYHRLWNDIDRFMGKEYAGCVTRRRPDCEQLARQSYSNNPKLSSIFKRPNSKLYPQGR